MAQSTDTRRGAKPPGDRLKRGNGTGSVYPYRSGFRAAFTWRDGSGKQRRTVVTAPTRDAADRALVRLRDDYEAGKPPPDTGTVADYLKRWLETSRQDVRPATWRERSASLRTHVIPALGRLRLARLTPSDVEAMTSGMLAAGSAPRTAAAARTNLRRALADAQRDALVQRNVAALARPPRRVRHELVYLDTRQLRRLLDGLGDDQLGPIITLAATTGLRQGELRGLRWQDVDLTTATLTVRRSLALAWNGTYQLAEPKTARSRRTINLPARALAALEVERERQEARTAALGAADWQDRDGLVFTDAVGRPLRNDSVTHGFQKRLAALGLPRVAFHALRHSAASALLAAGVPLKTVSETLGHSSITLTADTYAHLAPELRKDAADAMDRVLG